MGHFNPTIYCKNSRDINLIIASDINQIELDSGFFICVIGLLVEIK